MFQSRYACRILVSNGRMKVEGKTLLQIKLKLDDVLHARRMSKKSLSDLTRQFAERQGDKSLYLHPTRVSEIANNVRQSVSRKHLSIIAHVLGITDIAELIDFAPADEPSEGSDDE